MYVYNEADQLTAETTGETATTYLYDANGALTKSDDATTVNAYTYDYDGYQTAFDTTGTSNDATYTYDADRRRIRKVVNSVTTKYFLEGSDVIADYDGDDALVAMYITPGLDNNVSQTRSDSTYYYMKDALGSIRNLVDSSEATQNRYDYYAFGKELGTWTQSITNRYTYTAREYDPEAKQYYYRARYYGGKGRFASRDSALQGTNSYFYVANQPQAFLDPLGRRVEKKGIVSGMEIQMVNSTRYGRVLATGFTQHGPKVDYTWMIPVGEHCSKYNISACWFPPDPHFMVTTESSVVFEGGHIETGQTRLEKDGYMEVTTRFKYWVDDVARQGAINHELKHQDDLYDLDQSVLKPLEDKARQHEYGKPPLVVIGSVSDCTSLLLSMIGVKFGEYGLQDIALSFYSRMNQLPEYSPSTREKLEKEMYTTRDEENKIIDHEWAEFLVKTDLVPRLEPERSP